MRNTEWCLKKKKKYSIKPLVPHLSKYKIWHLKEMSFYSHWLERPKNNEHLLNAITLHFAFLIYKNKFQGRKIFLGFVQWCNSCLKVSLSMSLCITDHVLFYSSFRITLKGGFFIIFIFNITALLLYRK